MWKLSEGTKFFLATFLIISSIIFVGFMISFRVESMNKSCYEQTQEKGCWGIRGY